MDEVAIQGATSQSRTKPDDYARKMFDEVVRLYTFQDDVLEIQAAQDILNSDPDVQLGVVMVCVEEHETLSDVKRIRAAEDLLKHLLKKPLAYTKEDLLFILEIGAHSYEPMTEVFPIKHVLSATEKWIAKHGLTQDLSMALLALSKVVRQRAFDKPHVKLSDQIRFMSSGTDTEDSRVIIVPQEAWSDLAIAQLNAMPSDLRANWESVLRHATTLSATKPSKKWLTESQPLLDKLGRDELRSRLTQWLPLISKKGTAVIDPRTWNGIDPTEQICTPNTDILKGLVWFLVHYDDDAAARLLGDTAEAAFKKVPGIGPRCPRIGNACVGALSSMTFKEAIAQLSRLKAKSKGASSQTQIGRGLEAAAEKAGMTVDDLQELSVPDYGFTEIGLFTKKFGDYQASISIAGPRSAQIVWSDASGKLLSTVPAAVKRDFAPELKALKTTATDLEKILPSVRQRIEGSLLQQRHWNYKSWRERYLDHPICGAIARKLIWNFNGKPGVWQEAKLVDLSGKEIEVEDATLVELWHPIASTSDEVVAWRQWLQDHDITQPFKQAHREIYVLTDAERQTGSYSNRFAAHILRQHQFSELCKQRGWKYTLQGGWDSWNTPVLQLPNWDMQVDFHVDAAAEDVQSATGVYMHVSTDQVRFSRLGRREVINLTEVMPIVFTEVMRDVDLFVGVCSIGNDATWQDGGRWQNYWQEFSFGDLGATAQTRKEVLKTIVPRLKIASRCSFADKFIVVQGDLRTYKIHLGSGNILMEPNDQYLCIVPSRADAESSKAGGVFLPFEGDHQLSVILSKCFLLADDSKITDATIVSQIRRK